LSVASSNVSSGNPYDITNLIVGRRFRGLRGPVDQPGTQRVRAGRRSPAWQVILDPECGKALTLLRRAAGSNPARSTTNRLWREVRVGPRGVRKIHQSRFKNLFQVPVHESFREPCFKERFQEPEFRGAILRGESKTRSKIGFL